MRAAAPTARSNALLETWFAQIIKSPDPNCFGGGIYRRLAGHQQNLDVGSALTQGLEQFNPSNPRHQDVGNYNVKTALFQQRPGRFNIFSGFYRIARAAQKRIEGPADALFVIHY